MNKKIVFISPLLGSAIATTLMVAYAGIKASVGVMEIFDLFQMIPLIFVIITSVSYLISLPIGLFLINRRNCYLWSSGTFIFISCLIGSILGIALSLINYHYEESIFKSFFIFVAVTMAATFNASFFIALENALKAKEGSQ